MKEQDWMERLKQEAQQIPVPETLEPEAVKQRLETYIRENSLLAKGEEAADRVAEHGSFTQDKTADTEKTETPKGVSSSKNRQLQAPEKNRGRYRWKRAVAVAAVALLVIGGGAAFGHFHNSQGGGEENLQAAQTKDTPRSYGQIYDLLDQLTAEESSYGDMSGSRDIAFLEDKEVVIADQKDSAESKVLDSAASAAGSEAAAEDYSGTNVQTQQVDEGDLVKTDGSFIYTLDQNYNTITIVRVKGKSMEKVSDISLADDFLPREFYVNQDALSVLGQEPQEGDNMMDQTAVYTFDIKNKSKPGKGKRFTQSGTLSSSRMEGNHLYIFTSFCPFMPENKDKTREYIPQINGEVLKLGQISIPGKPQIPEFLVMASIDLAQPDKSADQKAVFAAGDTFYVSQDHIYAASVCGADGRITEIRKFAYDKGNITYKSKGSVKGRLESSFSMDEYKDHLRLVTTLDTIGGGTYNNVYVLGANMEIAGSILKLAKDERVYSARFMGDIGYFVTFRETDPLFSVDLSQPENPRIIGKLKIPGFSEYLHAYGSGLLLGVGMEANEEGETGGVKLSMFDIAKPKNVKEKSIRVLKGAYDAEVLTNHHAILADPEKNIIAFAAEGDNGASYYVFEYTNKDFRLILRKHLGNFGYGARGLYIGSTFYLVQADGITAYSMKDFKEIGRIAI